MQIEREKKKNDVSHQDETSTYTERDMLIADDNLELLLTNTIGLGPVGVILTVHHKTTDVTIQSLTPHTHNTHTTRGTTYAIM